MIQFNENVGKSTVDPCVKCYVRDLCDDGECGRKLFPIWTNKPPKFK